MDSDFPANGHDDRQGRWVSEGGRLRWIPARDMPAAQDDSDMEAPSAADLDQLDETMWASDRPPLPAGAPESARVRAALAWLRRMRDQEREILGELALIERDQYRQQDASPQPRRARDPQPFSLVTLEIAEHGAAADWYDTAYAALEEAADQSSDRALVEWYLWLVTNAPIADAATTEIAAARTKGAAEAHLRARLHAEHLALPEMDDEE
jgi:hypothetical protein